MTRSPRRTSRPAVAATLAAALATLAALATGCGSGGVAADPPATSGPTHGGQQMIDTPVGERPAFTAEDYTYELVVSCFCPEAGNRVTVTVHDGAVTRVGTGPHAPEAPAFLEVTIPEVIDRALDPRVDEVTLRWPAGQAWPRVASLDPITNAVDDEIGYAIAGVRITG